MEEVTDITSENSWCLSSLSLILVLFVDETAEAVLVDVFVEDDDVDDDDDNDDDDDGEITDEVEDEMRRELDGLSLVVVVLVGVMAVDSPLLRTS